METVVLVKPYIYIIQAGPGDSGLSETIHIHYTSRTWRKVVSAKPYIYIIQARPGDSSPSETLHILYTSRT